MSVEVDHGIDSQAEIEGVENYMRLLVDVVSERDTNKLVSMLYTEVENNEKVDWRTVEDAITFGDIVHAGQVRNRDIPPPGQPQKEFIAHTIGATVLAARVLGPDATTEDIVATLVHDTVEDGKLNRGTPEERPVTNADIRERYGEGVARRVAAFSDVKDIPTPDGGTRRIKLSKKEYAKQLMTAATEHPEDHILEIKFGGDLNYNLLDPFTQLQPPVEQEPSTRPGRVTVVYDNDRKDSWSSRNRKIASAREKANTMLRDKPILRQLVLGAADIAHQTVNQGFNANKITLHMPVRAAA